MAVEGAPLLPLLLGRSSQPLWSSSHRRQWEVGLLNVCVCVVCMCLCLRMLAPSKQLTLAQWEPEGCRDQRGEVGLLNVRTVCMYVWLYMCAFVCVCVGLRVCV